MKASIKIALIIAGVLVVAGGILCAAAFALAGGDWDRFQVGGENVVREEYTASPGEVTSISIEAVTSDITVKPSSDGNIRLTYGRSDYRGMDIDLSPDGTLHAESIYNEGKPWYKYISFNWSDGVNSDIVLELPGSYTGTLMLSGETADMDINGISVKGDMSFAVATGFVHVENAEAKTLSIASNTGNISVSESSFGAVLLAVNTGKIDVEDVTSNADVSFASGSGDVTLNDVHAAGIATASATTGDISIDELSAAEIDLETTTGRIGGTLEGTVNDYMIFSTTTTGRNSLTSGNYGSIPLTVKTTTGNIDISFDD